MTEYVIRYKQPWLQTWQDVQSTRPETAEEAFTQADGLTRLFPGAEVVVVQRDITETILHPPFQNQLM